MLFWCILLEAILAVVSLRQQSQILVFPEMLKTSFSISAKVFFNTSADIQRRVKRSRWKSHRKDTSLHLEWIQRSNHYAFIKRHSRAAKQESREAALVTGAPLCLQGELDCRLHRRLIFTSSVNPLRHSRSFFLKACVCVWDFTSASLHPKHHSSKTHIRSYHILLKQTALRR